MTQFRPKLRGFTLIEVLLVLGLLVTLVSLAVPAGGALIGSYFLDRDRDILVTLLEETRSQAMANVNGSAHGVALTPQNFVAYQGSSYATRDTSRDYTYPRSATVNITGLSEVTFQPLSAQTSAATVTLSVGSKQRVVRINTEGMIDW